MILKAAAKIVALSVTANVLRDHLRAATRTVREDLREYREHLRDVREGK